MIHGIDISHHNKNMKDLKDLLKFDFIIMKASEGMGFRDNAVSLYMNVLKDKPIGFYHFARPEINSDPKVEARNFINAILPYLKYNPVLALDVEARALDVPFVGKWSKDFCKYVFDNIGILPLIYCSASSTTLFKDCVDFGCGLWVAKWSKTEPTKKQIKPWEFWAIWQYTSGGICSGVRVDLNYFNGTVEQFKKYGEVNHGQRNTTTDNPTT